MTSVAELRPGSVREGELATLEEAIKDGSLVGSPPEILDLLAKIVKHLRAGDGVTLVPIHAELSTIEAAELLNISRPHLIKQLQAGALPHRMVGSHRRLRLADVLDYRDRLDAQAHSALEELTRQAEELGLYD